jgi:hypothetical protein
MLQTNLVEKIITHFMLNRAVYEIMYENGTTRQPTDDNKIRRMRFACWITKATNTHSENVILIAFPAQNVCAKALPIYMYVRC